ncbi:hypothetical protein [Streptomyces sp. NPDC050507]|uniref:hypothetical protein n=1 Tax=Streptomyces sp. NPDC050507 TaxID=3365619 RepID=UPI00378BECF2
MYETITIGRHQVVLNHQPAQGFTSMAIVDEAGDEVAHDVLTRYESATLNEFFEEVTSI